LTEDYNLELQYRKPFLEIWEDEKNDRELGPLSERMGVRDRNTGDLLMTEEEKDAVSKCFSPVQLKLLPLANSGQASIMHSVSTKFKPVLISIVYAYAGEAFQRKIDNGDDAPSSAVMLL
jgi:hypothetical protein